MLLSYRKKSLVLIWNFVHFCFSVDHKKHHSSISNTWNDWFVLQLSHQWEARHLGQDFDSFLCFLFLALCCLKKNCFFIFMPSFVQALGCILYLLCFKQHPFEEGAKLQIVNGKYSVPQNDSKYTVFHDLIRTYCLFVSKFLILNAFIHHSFYIVPFFFINTLVPFNQICFLFWELLIVFINKCHGDLNIFY